VVQKATTGTNRLGRIEDADRAKYENVDVDDIRMKLDAIKQEPKEQV
jgi:S-adenosylhomocysteine hydrolase